MSQRWLTQPMRILFGVFLCSIAPQSLVDALPRAYEACQDQVAGAQCLIKGSVTGSDRERKGSCIELLPSERGCTSPTADSKDFQSNVTLACISCDVSTKAFGRMDQWAIFAFGAILGSLLTTAMCVLLLKFRKTLDFVWGARNMSPSSKAAEDQAQLDSNLGPPPRSPPRKRQGSNDKPKTPRKKKRPVEASSEVAPSTIGSLVSDEDQQSSRNKNGLRRQEKRGSRPENTYEEADVEDNDHDEVERNGRNVVKSKGNQENGKQHDSSEGEDGEVGRKRLSNRAEKAPGGQVKQQGRGTRASLQQESLDEALQGIEAQIDSLPMHKVSDALNGTNNGTSPAAPKTAASSAPFKAAPMASKNFVNTTPSKEHVKREAKWDQVQTDLDDAMEGGHAGLRVAPRL